jgi:hypothetical protein
MPLQQQIDGLRRRFQSGDNSAREALQRLLYSYLVLVVGRAARAGNSGSRIAAGIRRLSMQPGPQGVDGNGLLSTSVDELCRRLCDELLQAPALGEQIQKVFETIRSLGRSTALFGLQRG